MYFWCLQIGRDYKVNELQIIHAKDMSLKKTYLFDVF